MDKITKEALEKAIQKWEFQIAKLVILKGEPMTHHTLPVEECPLCVLFNDRLNCLGCPVRDKVGQTYCYGTPYYDAINLKCAYATNNVPINDRLIDAYTEEVNFLKSLREDCEEPCSE